jgi:signal transduction histidine kinase
LPGARSGGRGAFLPATTALAAIGLGWLGETRRGLLLASAGLILSVSNLSVIEAHPTWAQVSSIAAPPLFAGLAAAALVPLRASLVCTLGGLLAGPARLIFYDPFRDPECTECFRQAALLFPDTGLAKLLGLVGAGLVMLGLVLGVRRGAHRFLIVVALLTVLVAARSWAGMPAEGASLFLVVPVAIAITLDIGAVIIQRQRLAGLAEALRAGVRAERTLRVLMDDPDLRVDYRGPSQTAAHFVDADGAPSATSTSRVVTEVKGPGGVIARIHSDPNRGPASAFTEGLSPEVRLGLEQEQMSAVLASQARELAESRERLVRRGDAERRALERDLHDGAQQHLLALGFDLQVALASVALPDADRRALEECRSEARAALDDLRDLSHGLYAPLLATSGLLPALRALARTTPVDVLIEGDWEARPPRDVERACYLVVADLARRSTSPLRVSGRHSAGPAPTFTVMIAGSSCPPDRVLEQRVAALGGSMRHSVDGADLTTEVVLPCA